MRQTTTLPRTPNHTRTATTTRTRVPAWAGGGALLALALGACAPGGTASSAQAGGAAPAQPAAVASTADSSGSEVSHRGRVVAQAKIRNPEGQQVGSLEMERVRDGVKISVQVYRGLKPGFHGLHLHAIGKCEPNSPDPTNPSNVGHFNSSGGHLGTGSHPDHAGDLPSLYVNANGRGTLVTVTDRLSRALVMDENGTAVVIHAGSDNYGNIPTRYASNGPDDATKRTGDAGGRAACGVVRGA